MVLSPHEWLEGALLFLPQWYDSVEIAYLRSSLGAGDVFVDVGANVGLYTLIAARQVGDRGLVVAIEADPRNASILRHNVELNRFQNVTIVQAGVSGREEELPLGLNTTGNRSGHSFLTPGPDAIPIKCQPLSAFIDRAPKGIKLDIEGFEYRVLDRYLSDGCYRPDFMIFEVHPNCEGDVVGLLGADGYIVEKRTAANVTMRRR